MLAIDFFLKKNRL